MTRVAVVTDSTAYLPAGMARAHGITVVPLHVVLGNRTGSELDVPPSEVAAALRERRVQVTTSRPTPAELAAAYRGCGAQQVVSVHLSGELSGTGDSARIAAREVAADGIEVAVVDSRSIAMGMGFAVLAAAKKAAAGARLDAVVTAAGLVERTTTLFYVDTLEHLRRGGRMTAASALLGTALSVKPLLVVKEGRIGLREKVRTFSRALARMQALVAEASGDGLVDVAVHHLEAPERAKLLADSLHANLPGLRSLHTSEVGAVVGAHVGPGLLGVVVCRR